MTTVWYHVRNLDAAREFYTRKLGFTETSHEDKERWATFEHGQTSIGVAEGEPQPEGPVAHVDVEDVKEVGDRLREDGVDVGVVLELHGEMRLLDVFDPDGNRLEFAQDVAGGS